MERFLSIVFFSNSILQSEGLIGKFRHQEGKVKKRLSQAAEALESGIVENTSAKAKLKTKSHYPITPPGIIKFKKTVINEKAMIPITTLRIIALAFCT